MAIRSSELSRIHRERIKNGFLQSSFHEKNIAMLMDCCIPTGLKHAPQITASGWLCFAKQSQIQLCLIIYKVRRVSERFKYKALHKFIELYVMLYEFKAYW